MCAYHYHIIAFPTCQDNPFKIGSHKVVDIVPIMWYLNNMQFADVHYAIRMNTKL